MNSGSYQLTILVRSPITVRIGRLGDFAFEPGTYIYTGSAMRNLNARIARHLRHAKQIRWHIDYLLAAEGVEIIDVRKFPSATREECFRNLDLINRGATAPVPGFGSSDCRLCPAHLLLTPVA